MLRGAMRLSMSAPMQPCLLLQIFGCATVQKAGCSAAESGHCLAFELRKLGAGIGTCGIPRFGRLYEFGSGTVHTQHAKLVQSSKPLINALNCADAIQNRMNTMLLLASALVPVLVLAAPAAYAHPYLGDTVPQQFSNAQPGIREVIVHYSEAVEIDFSKLEVLNSNGDKIDNGDTSYYQGESSLIVTTPPLEEGVYTVTSKVLSKVDGHLVPDAFIFGVGDVALPEDAGSAPAELIFLPEAGARFPGLVGQSIVLGAAIASIILWGMARQDGEQILRAYHGKFMILIGAGLIAVLVSNIAMLAVQAWRLEASALAVLETTSGFTWIVRMSVTVVLFAVWFAMERKAIITKKRQIPLLAASLCLAATTTMMGHGAASEQFAAVALDYVHNLTAAAWIGGVIFLAFVLIPTFAGMGGRGERLSLAAIPRFSGIAIIAVGLVIVSGPLLMYLLESNLGAVAGSTYGRLIMVKIALASGMIGIGAYHQFAVQKRAERDSAFPVTKKLRRALKAESGLGVALLLVVALLANGTLPAGEVQTADARSAFAGLSIVEFSENAKFDIAIKPYVTGKNQITVQASGHDGEAIEDMAALQVKVSNPAKGVFPIEVPLEEADGTYKGEITFGFSGDWQIEAEAQRTAAANEAVTLLLQIKPQLADMSIEIIEYEFPEPAAPLYPVHDNGRIWISDASAPRIWQYDIGTGEFASYPIGGRSSTALAVDSAGKVWFTDVPEGAVGYLVPETGEFERIELPRILPANQRSLPIVLDVGPDDAVWIPIANKNVILRYDQNTQEFEQYEMATEDSGPFAAKAGPDGRVWFTEQTAGQIGYIDHEAGEIMEFAPEPRLQVPETITFDENGDLWISEHRDGGGLAKFNPVLERFTRVQSPDPEAFPNSAVQDRYGNIWFAMHTVDKLGVYDPVRGDMLEIPIPTDESWVQFTASDYDGSVWFVEQQPYKLGMIRLTEMPSSARIVEDAFAPAQSYAEVAGPLMAAGIIAASLFFVKSARDSRRLAEGCALDQ